MGKDPMLEEEEIIFSAEEVGRWKREVAMKRDKLFSRNWKNRRLVPHLKSRQDVEKFDFLVGWVNEVDEVVKREKERNLFDDLHDLGLDVNDPRYRESGRRAKFKGDAHRARTQKAAKGGK